MPSELLAVVNFENESNWQWWNIGGWQNTQHCLEYAPSGSNNHIGDPVKGGVIVGDWNDIEIIVDNQYITCILNGDTIHKNVVNPKHRTILFMSMMKAMWYQQKTLSAEMAER